MADWQEFIDAQVATLDEEIEKLNVRMAKFDVLKEKRDRLEKARAALIGNLGRTRSSGGGKGARSEEIAQFLSDNPGSSPGEIAEALGVNQPTVSSALYRGKGEAFLSKNGKWWNKKQDRDDDVVDGEG